MSPPLILELTVWDLSSFLLILFLSSNPISSPKKESFSLISVFLGFYFLWIEISLAATRKLLEFLCSLRRDFVSSFSEYLGNQWKHTHFFVIVLTSSFLQNYSLIGIYKWFLPWNLKLFNCNTVSEEQCPVSGPVWVFSIRVF